MLELQNKVLERIAKGEPLTETLETLCRLVEARLPGIQCSVLRVENGVLHPLAAPSLPKHYSDALDNLEIGPLVALPPIMVSPSSSRISRATRAGPNTGH